MKKKKISVDASACVLVDIIDHTKPKEKENKKTK